MALYRGKKQKRRWFRRSRYSSNYRTRRSTRIRHILLAAGILLVLFAVGFFVLEPMIGNWLWGDRDGVVSDTISSSDSTSAHSSTEVPGPSGSVPSTQPPEETESQPQETPTPQNPVTQAVLLTSEQLCDPTLLSQSIQRAKEEGAGLVLLEIKGKDGQLAYQSDLAAVKRIDAVKEGAVDLRETIAAIRVAGMEAGVSVTVFDEDYTASKLRDAAIKYAGSETTRWLNFEHQYRQDPGLAAAQDYELAILEELAAHDLAVISLSGCHYPVWGDLTSCTCDTTRTRQENILDFVSSARTIVNGAGIKLDVTVPADVAVGDLHTRYRYYGYPEDLTTLDCDTVTADLRLDRVFNRYYTRITVDGVGYADLTGDGESSVRLLYGAASSTLGEVGVLTDRTLGTPATVFDLLSSLEAGRITCQMSPERVDEEETQE